MFIYGAFMNDVTQILLQNTGHQSHSFFTPHYVDEREDLESVTLTLAFLQQL